MFHFTHLHTHTLCCAESQCFFCFQTLMMNNFCASSSSPSHHFIHYKPKSNVVDHENEKQHQDARFHKCDLCSREFTTGNALGGHKSFHRAKDFLQPKIKQLKHDHGIKIGSLKIKHSCVLCSKAFLSIKALNGHMKRHSQYGSKKGSNNYDQDQFPPFDLTKYLPQIMNKTKKRSRRLRDVIDVEAANVAEIMLDFSRQSSPDLDVNHRDSKTMKLCRNVDENDEKLVREKDINTEKNRLVVRLKIPKGLIFQSQACKQPASNDDNNNTDEDDETDGESTHELGSNVCRDFDLNELPADDVADETTD